MEGGGAGKKRLRREEEVLETALAAGGAALLVSGLKKLLPCVLKQWPMATALMSPPPLLFLILNLIIASIVVISFHPAPKCEKRMRHPSDPGRRKHGGCSKAAKRPISALGSKEAAQDVEDQKPIKGMDKQLVEEDHEEEEHGDAAELNARVEAFIAAFRRQLRVDSFSSGIHRTKIGGSQLSCYNYN